MLTALTRAISPSINRCELSRLPRRPIDLARAEAQHRSYQARLRELGVQVISLPPEPDLPDSVFVEDAAVVLDEIAVIARMGALSRRPETESLARALAPFRPLRSIAAPAALEGGDVVRVESSFFAGLSERTNAEGIEQFAGFVEPLGYSVEAVPVAGCLHLKTACCYLGRETLLANRAWFDPAPLRRFRILDVAPEEPWAADVLALDGAILMPAAFPATRRILEREGFQVCALDISELMKAEAGITCMSLLFETERVPAPFNPGAGSP